MDFQRFWEDTNPSEANGKEGTQQFWKSGCWKAFLISDYFSFLAAEQTLDKWILISEEPGLTCQAYI